MKKEDSHTIYIGEVGSGKTDLIKREYQRVFDEDENVKFVINDISGTYLTKFFNEETDLLFYCNGSIEMNIEEWISTPGNSTIFLLNYAGEENTNHAESLINEILKTQLKSHSEQKVHYILDNFEMLNKIENIFNGISIGRAHGIRIIATLTDSDLVDIKYGKAQSAVILKSFPKKLFL